MGWNRRKRGERGGRNEFELQEGQQLRIKRGVREEED
jgi:hypothetical protein